MKKTARLTIVAALCAAVMTTVGFLPAANAAGQDENNYSITKYYYAKNPTTVDQLDKTWGKPAAVSNFDNGQEERFYKEQNTLINGYRTFLVQDGKVVDCGLSVSLPDAPKGKTGIARK